MKPKEQQAFWTYLGYQQQVGDGRTEGLLVGWLTAWLFVG